MYTLSQIAQITGAQFKGQINYAIDYFLNDSRNFQTHEKTLFIALKTNRNNGHQYIDNLIQLGLKSFLIQENELDYEKYLSQNVSFVISKNPLETIQKLAKHHRQQFKIPVIGITGSNGKTIVKEWLYQLLKPNYVICRSPKSFNSQLGVPLSVLHLNHTHTLAIFEAGISTIHEMDHLADIIQPTITIVTSLGSAHNEGFDTIQIKLNEKLKLTEKSELVIINGINRELIQLNKNFILVSENKNADFQIKFLNEAFDLLNQDKQFSFELPFNDKASLTNAATCAVLMLQLGINENIVAERLKKLQSVALRLEIKTGIHNSILINDFYNSDIESIRIALSFMHQQNQGLKKIVIVSDIEQTGIDSKILYTQLAELMSQNQIERVVGIGSEISKYKFLFNNKSLFFNSTQDFEKSFSVNQFLFSSTCVLLKGARSFGFENISQLLQLKSHDTVFEINLNTLINNLNYYKSILQPNVAIMGMVKAMGYGSGSIEIARTLQHQGIQYLAVAYADEAVELRKANIQIPIMIMNPEKDAFDDIINYHLEPEIYSFKILKDFINRLDNMGVSEAYPIHLKIDTGMHRLGFLESDIPALLEVLKVTPQIKIKAVFSHLVGSDNASLDDFTTQQISTFKNVSNRLEENLNYQVIKHLCNSGGITRYPNAHFNMVRLGIGMYGLGVNESEQKHLENVGSLRTKISQIKKVKKGDTIGYNRNGFVTEDTRIATLPIGYADGFGRQLGNGNHGVFIKNTFCKTIGNVCMDMCMVVINDIQCEEGDEVIIFENANQINLMAKALDTIPYEILTNVSGRVKRIYVQE